MSMRRSVRQWVVIALSLGWACLAIDAYSQIAVGPRGTSLLTFDAAPSLQEWATESFGGDGGGGGITSPSALDAQVSTVSVAMVGRVLASTATVPPSQNNYSRWNSAAKYLQSRIGNNEFTLLVATFANVSGTALQTLEISYLMGGGSFSTEQVPGFRVYFSFTGQAGSWTVIPGLSTGTTGEVSTVLSLADFGAWHPNTLLYLLWADDNGLGSDGYYTIDNFRVSLGPSLLVRPAGTNSIEVSWPAAWLNHELQATTSLAQPHWQTVIGSLTLSNGWNRMLVTTPPAEQFFRTEGGIIIPGTTPQKP